MSPAREVFSGRRAEGSTRRELLEAGAAGLAGLGLVATRRAEADGVPSGSQDQSTGRRLEAGLAADVGMSQSRLDRVVDCLTAETEQRRVTSASIFVARYGRIVLHRGFGRLSEQADAPDRADTVYILASISKPIAVCGLMLLVERGDVVLSDRAALPAGVRRRAQGQGEVWHSCRTRQAAGSTPGEHGAPPGSMLPRAASSRER
jgi:CubicO group peptidase (beta-lactamase class C family)